MSGPTANQRTAAEPRYWRYLFGVLMTIVCSPIGFLFLFAQGVASSKGGSVMAGQVAGASLPVYGTIALVQCSALFWLVAGRSAPSQSLVMQVLVVSAVLVNLIISLASIIWFESHILGALPFLGNALAFSAIHWERASLLDLAPYYCAFAAVLLLLNGWVQWQRSDSYMEAAKTNEVRTPYSIEQWERKAAEHTATARQSLWVSGIFAASAAVFALCRGRPGNRTNKERV